ncbi:MAG: hypothetical protein ABIA37_03115, partial [Candidatus Woesearchaeota archaeon]
INNLLMYYSGVYKLKKTYLMLLGIILMVSLGAFAQAAVEITSGLTDGKVALDVDYGDLREDNESLILNPISLTFENKGNTSETVNLAFSGVLTGYNLNLSTTSFTLDAVGGNTTTKTITLSATVPAKEDSGNHDVGKLMVGSTEYVIQTRVESMLVFNDIKVYVNGDKKTTLDSDGDSIKDVRPGSTVELKFRIDNNFDDEYDEGDIEDATLSVQFKNDNDEDDFDDEIDEEEDFDLDAGDSEDGLTISIDVPTTAQEGSYELLIAVGGEDNNNAQHTNEWTITLKVNRDKDDVQIETATLSSDLLKCTRTTSLKLKLTNFGSNDQDAAAISIYNSALGINYNFDDIEMDKDPDDDTNSFSKTIPLNIDEEADAGDYYLELYAYIDGDEEVDYKTIKLTVEDCKTSTITAEENKSKADDVIVVSAFPEDNTNQQSGTPFVETTESSFTESKGMIVLLGLAGVLLVVFIILLIWLLVRGR